MKTIVQNILATHVRDIESKKNIKSFFTNPQIIDLIIKERSSEFKTFNYSTNVNDIQ